MRKYIVLMGLYIGLSQLTFAQSATLLPNSSDFNNDSDAPNSYAIKGVLSNQDQGAFSVAVRGMNMGNANFGIGVWGSHAAQGYGVYGSSQTGKGVVGFSSGGFGVFTQSDTGVGLYSSSFSGGAAKFEINNSNNTSTIVDLITSGTGKGLNIELTNTFNDKSAVSINHSGTGVGIVANTNSISVWGVSTSELGAGVAGDNTVGPGVVGRSSSPAGSGGVVGLNDNSGYGVKGFNTKNGIGVYGQAGASGGAGIGGKFENINSSNTNNALEAITNGGGAGAYIRNVNANGNGAGLIVQKNVPYAGAFTSNGNADFEVRHPIQATEGMSGLRIVNTGPNLNSWTFYTQNAGDGTLSLYNNGVNLGFFNPNTGAYTTVSDANMKTNILTYSNTLDNLLKLGVKSYHRLKSDKTEVGLIAQEALQYFPEIVYEHSSDTGEKFYTMDYSRIGVLAIKAIQEQQAIIQAQGRQVALLLKEVSELKKMIEKK